MSAGNEEVPTIDPEIEPEYVGAHSALAREDCRNWLEPDADGQCPNDATHTVVMYQQGSLHEIPMCDDCGEPQDVTADDREWSGEVQA